MALVSSPIRFSRGSIGNLSFYQDSKGRTIARQKRGETRDFHTNDRRYLQLLAASEFSQISSLASRLRHPVDKLLKYCSDAYYFNRLVGVLRLAADTDYKVKLGARTATRGNAVLLEGFEFNSKRHLSDTLKADYLVQFDPESRTTRIDVESFIPRQAIKGPAGAKSFQIIAVAAGVSHTSYVHAMEVSNLIGLDEQPTGPISLEIDTPGADRELVAVYLGVVFYEKYQNAPMLMRDGALSIVRIEKQQPLPPVPPLGHHQDEDLEVNTMTQEAIEDQVQRTLASKYPIKVFVSSKNPNPAGDIDRDVIAVQQDFWRRQLTRYLKG